MRVRRLELRAFGPFTGATLDFGAGAPRLHLVHGRNEAGKSTALRALVGLLFGIPRRTVDDHLHPYKDMRLGAVLASEGGRELGVVRRKADKNDLLSMDDETPLEAGVLARLLGGVDEELYRAMYGLDHRTLRSGGEALLRGEGDLGASLLDAGLGGRGIHRVIGELEQEAEALFVPRGKTRRLNEAIKAYREANKAVRTGEVSAEAWQAQKEAIDHARAERERLDEARQRAAEEKHQLSRVLSVLGPLAKRRVCLEERGALGEVRPLSEEAIARREEAERESDQCVREMARLESEIADLEARREALVVPEGLLDVPDDLIAEVRDRLGSHRKARADRPRLEARLRQMEVDATSIVEGLGRDLPLHEAGTLRVRAGFARRVRELAQERGRLEGALDHATRAVEDADRRLGAAVGRLTAALGIDELPPVETLAVPDEDVIAEFAARLEETRRAVEQADQRQEELEARARDVARDLDAEAKAGEVPTEAELADARAERDDRWSQVRGSGLGEGRAEAFEGALRTADEVADRLRREAARVATRARLEADRKAVEREREANAERRAALASRGAHEWSAWREAWSAAGFEPLAPARMRAWLRDLAEARGASEARRRAEDERAAREQALWAWRAQWTAHMAELELDAGASASEAEAVLDARGALFDKLEAATEVRRRIEGMDRDAEGLAELVGRLCEAHAPDLAELPMEARGDALVRRHTEARHDLRTREQLDRDLSARRAQLAELRRRKARADDVLAASMREAGAGDIEALRAAEARARRARALDEELRRLEDQILEAGQGASIEALAREAAGLEATEVRARLDALESDLVQLDDERQQAQYDLARKETGLEVLESKSAAEAASDAQAELARVRAHGHEYVRLRVAATVLRRELDRYRDRHQGPVLSRANELFPRLTCGAYAGVKAGFGPNDEPVIVCVRGDGKEVPVEGLSDGTRDQLYLALRVATLEHHAANAEPLPVILDDVFVHFDDERTRAGLEVLGELAGVMQVLLFTHHARVVELAREAVPADRLELHDLDAIRAREPGPSLAPSA